MMTDNWLSREAITGILIVAASLERRKPRAEHPSTIPTNPGILIVANREN